MAKKRRTVTNSHDGVTPEEVKAIQPGYSAEALSEWDISAPQQADQRIREEANQRESESAEELPYTVGWWKGFRQWRCKLCPWDTLESEAAMLEHIAAVHKPPPSPILIADKRGRVINRE